MSGNWWEFPVTQSFNPPTEYGVDVGTPFHTLITAPLAGTVKDVNCAVGYRCEVDIASQFQGSPITQTFLHIDQPAVQAGQVLTAGSAIGLSGGQTSGGSNPDSTTYSTGPHVEFDLFQGGPFQSPLNHQSYYNFGGPDASLAATAAGSSTQTLGAAPVLPGGAPGQRNPGTPPAPGSPSGTFDPLGINAAITGAGHGLANFLGADVNNVTVWARRNSIALFVALVVTFILFGDAGSQQAQSTA
jgi:hypothetical protein